MLHLFHYMTQFTYQNYDFEKKRKSILEVLEKKEKVFGEKMKRFEDMLPKIIDDEDDNGL